MEEMNNNMFQEPQEVLRKDKRGFAVASMVLGIISMPLICLGYWPSIPCAVLAIIFGALSIKSSGQGMAIAGLVLGIIVMVVDIIFFAIGMVFWEIFNSMIQGRMSFVP